MAATAVRFGVETTLTAGHLTFTNLELSQYTGDAVISRSSYSVAGQRIAVKVAGDPVSANNGLFFVYTDHLGSSSILSDLTGTAVVAGSQAHYLPFGGYRGTAPTQTLTDRGYTGQKENLDLGLMYYNARYYIPGLGKFASADTLVPDPANPQSYNRYSYVYNNPIRFNDPTGHCAAGDIDCWALADQLYQQYGWYLINLNLYGTWSSQDVQALLDAALRIELWFARLGGGDARGRMRGTLGDIQFSYADMVGTKILENRDHVRGNTVYMVNRRIEVEHVIHEIGHVLDNRAAGYPLGALFGGGIADDMARFLGTDPTHCLNRSACSGYEVSLKNFPTNYAKNGPSEDFAETFMTSVLDPSSLASYPLRNQFIVNFAKSLTVSSAEFTGSP